MAPIPHRIILLKEINEKVTQRSLLSIILSAYIYEQHSLSGSKSQKVSPFLQMCFYMYKSLRKESKVMQTKKQPDTNR